MKILLVERWQRNCPGDVVEVAGDMACTLIKNGVGVTVDVGVAAIRASLAELKPAEAAEPVVAAEPTPEPIAEPEEPETPTMDKRAARKTKTKRWEV